MRANFASLSFRHLSLQQLEKHHTQHNPTHKTNRKDVRFRCVHNHPISTLHSTHHTLTTIDTADNAQDDYNKVQQTDNQAEFSHELIAGAGSFMAFRAFENHQRNEGTSPHLASYPAYPPPQLT